MIYEKRGLDKELAMNVAKQLSAHDRLGAHMRDQASLSRPLQAAWIFGGKLRDVRGSAGHCPFDRSGGATEFP